MSRPQDTMTNSKHILLREKEKERENPWMVKGVPLSVAIAKTNDQLYLKGHNTKPLFQGGLIVSHLGSLHLLIACLGDGLLWPGWPV